MSISLTFKACTWAANLSLYENPLSVFCFDDFRLECSSNILLGFEIELGLCELRFGLFEILKQLLHIQRHPGQRDTLVGLKS